MAAASMARPGRVLLVLIADVVLLRPALCEDGSALEGLQTTSAAHTYLSEDFFPGLHVLEPMGSDSAALTSGQVAAGGTASWLAYRGGQLPGREEPIAGGFQPVAVAMPSSWKDLRSSLALALKIPKAEPLQLPWALFDAQGRGLESLEALKRAPVAFVLEAGTWMWPAVRVGFEHVASVVGCSEVVLRTLSLRPKVFEVIEFFEDNETQELMELGSKQGLVDSVHESSVDVGNVRTSQQAWLNNHMSPLIQVLDTRVSQLMRVPASHNENVQLLRYPDGAFYQSHMDWTELDNYPEHENVWLDQHFGYQDRMATFFWYLNDVADGGETIFPKHGQPICAPLKRGGVKRKFCPGAEDPDTRSCEDGLKVKPRQGAAILWYNFHANGRGDRNSLHAGCPVGTGLEKWSANKWVRFKPKYSPPVDWVDDHPALKRYGFRGGAGEEL